MSEVGLETESGKTSAEDPQMDFKETDEADECLSEGVSEENEGHSLGREASDDVLCDIDINSTEENTDNSDQEDVQEEDEGIQSMGVVMCSDGGSTRASGSVDNGEHETNHQVEPAETPEECGDSHTQTKVMFTFT